MQVAPNNPQAEATPVTCPASTTSFGQRSHQKKVVDAQTPKENNIKNAIRQKNETGVAIKGRRNPPAASHGALKVLRVRNS